MVSDETRGYAVRAPEPADGAAVHGLIARCPPLDRNSMYCNLLQCSHLARTCALAESGGELAGFVSAYRLPDDPESLFVWQMAVAESMRGRGLAKAMLFHILARAACIGVRFIRTTVTRDNHPSRAVFRNVAGTLDAGIVEKPKFDAGTHFHGEHDSEHELIIGPFSFSHSFTNVKEVS